MSKTIQEQVFRFAELSDTAKAKAIGTYREGNNLDFLEDQIDAVVRAAMKKLKIEIVRDYRLLYSLSYCQGDGLCFEGMFRWKNWLVTIKQQGHYYHKRSVYFEFEYDGPGKPKIPEETIAPEFRRIYEIICDEAEKGGYEVIDAEYDEKNIVEQFETMGYWFRENGEFYEVDGE